MMEPSKNTDTNNATYWLMCSHPEITYYLSSGTLNPTRSG